MSNAAPAPARPLEVTALLLTDAAADAAQPERGGPEQLGAPPHGRPRAR